MRHITGWEAIGIFAGLGIWIGVTLFALTSFSDFHVRVYTHHRDIWRSLGGRETFDFRHQPINRLFFYCILRRYLEAGDPELTRLGNRASLGTILYFTSFAVANFFWLEWSWT